MNLEHVKCSCDRRRDYGGILLLAPTLGTVEQDGVYAVDGEDTSLGTRGTYGLYAVALDLPFSTSAASESDTLAFAWTSRIVAIFRRVPVLRDIMSGNRSRRRSDD